jgi:hypothetical protein
MVRARFVYPDGKPQRDEETGLWTVIPEDEDGAYAIQIISVLRGIRLMVTVFSH